MKIVQACPIPSLQPFFIDESRLLVSRESKTDKVDFISVSLINRKHMLCLTLIGAGGGGGTPTAHEIDCHLSRNNPNVLKLPDFSKNYLHQSLAKSFSCYYHSFLRPFLSKLFSHEPTQINSFDDWHFKNWWLSFWFSLIGNSPFVMIRRIVLTLKNNFRIPRASY